MTNATNNDSTMSNLDILQKLLPFTHSDGKVTEFSFYLGMGDWIITGITILLLSIFFYYIHRMFKSIGEDNEKIDYLLITLQKYQQTIQLNYNDFVEDLKKFESTSKHNKDNELYLLWNEFHESLLISKNPVTGASEYKNSIDADYFFNKKTLLTHVGTKLYSAIPSILLGLGLIGTFLGLFVGLVQLNMDDANTLRNSMKVLIHAAGVKFAASIWGLGLSLIFTISEKYQENKLEDKIIQIQNIINKAFERRTAEQTLEEISMNSEEQKNALNGLAATLTQQLSAELNATLVPSINSIGNNFSNMSQDISTAISSSLQEPLTKIAQTVEFASKSQNEQSSEIIRNLVERFIEKIDEKVGGQTDIFQQNIQSTQNLMNQVAENLKNFMEHSKHFINEQNEINKNRDSLIIENLSNIQISQKETIDKLVNSVANNIQTINESIANSIGNLQNSIANTTDNFIEKSIQREQNLNENVVAIINRIDETTNNMSIESIRRDEVIEHMLTSTQQTIKAAIEQISSTSAGVVSQISKDLESSIKEIKSQIDGILFNIKSNAVSVDQIITTASQKLNNLPRHLQQFDEIMEKMESLSSNIDNGSINLLGVSNKFCEFKESIGSFTSQIVDIKLALQNTAESSKQISEHSKATYNNLASQYEQILDKNENSMQKFEFQVESYRQQMQNSIEQVFGSFDKQLSTFASSLAAAVAELNIGIEELSELITKK